MSASPPRIPPAGLPALPFPTPGAPGSANLPPPPAPGSGLERAELALMHTIAKARTPAGDAWARHLDKAGKGGAWFELARLYRSRVGIVQGWLGTALLGA